MRIIGRILALFIAAICAISCSSPTVKPFIPNEKIGIVLLHGKGGDTRWVDPLASTLRSAGAQVLTPNMPWDKSRIYGKGFEESLLDIQRLVGQLRSAGANRIYVAGHSLGAIAAAGYGARIGDIQGIILLAPGHFTSQPDFERKFAEDVRKAEDLIASGKGDQVTVFNDISSGQSSTRYVSPNIYWSWFSPTGPADFVSNMSSLKDGVSVLYVAASRDGIPETKNQSYAFDKAPTNPKNKFVIISSSPLDVPRQSTEIVSDWLRNH